MPRVVAVVVSAWMCAYGAMAWAQPGATGQSGRSSQASAPAGQAGVSGRVLDGQGAPIENAVVTVTSATGLTRTVRTGPDGTFAVTDIASETVQVQASAPGFRASRQSVSLASAGTAGTAAAVTITLEVAGVQESVSVTGTAPASLTRPAETATRLGLTLLETPASVHVVDGDVIRERGDVSVADAQTRAVGVTAQGDPGNGGGSVAARGFGGVGSVMQLFDGDQLFVGAGTVTFPFDPWTVERIEVLGGPASVMYGTGAVGGAINVVPRRPNTVQRQHTARLSGGAFNTWRLAGDTTGPINDRASYRVAISRNQSDGWVDRGGSDSTALSAALRVELSPRLILTAAEDFGRQNPAQYFGGPTLGDRFDKTLRTINYNVADATIRYDDNWTQARLEWHPSSNVRLRTGLQFLKTDRHWRNVENYAIDGSRVFRESYIEIFHHQKQVGNRTDAIVTGTIAGRPNTLSVGADFNHVSFQHVNNSPYGGSSEVDLLAPVPGSFLNLAGTFPKYRTRTNRVAGFVEDRLVLSRALSVVAGARIDRYAVEREDLISGRQAERVYTPGSWRGGVVYAARPTVSVYGQVSTATDLIGNAISNSPARLLLEPTTGRQLEAGVKQTFWNQRGQWTVAAYQIVKKKLLAPDPGNPGTSVQIGQQSSRGVELTAGLSLSHGVRVDGNAALLRARFDDFAEVIGGRLVSRAGNRPPGVPERSANVWLSWSVTPEWQVRGGARVVGRRYWTFDNAGQVDGFTVVDAGASRSIGRRLTLDLRLWNLFDQVYATTFYDNVEPQWILGTPRSAELAVTLRF